MARVFRVLLWLLGGFVTLFVLVAVALYLFFDPNDFREQISQSVKTQTGRDLTIEGDISLELFPWLAVGIGKSSLGNAPGFGDEPMAIFESASFSVRLLPAILRQEIEVGSANIESLRLNLMADARGDNNWSDLVPEESASETESSTESSAGFNADSVHITDAMIRYTDIEVGETVVIDGLNLNVGRLQVDGSAVPINADLNFDVQPSGLGGEIALETILAFDMATGVLRLDGLSIDGTIEGVASIPTRVTLQTDGLEVLTNEQEVTMHALDLAAFDMHIVADIQPFSYESTVAPKAEIAIDAFSPRTLMRLFDVDPPETADPSALSLVIIDATVEVTASALDLTDLVIKMDDTSFTGTMSVPSTATGAYQFDLTGDSIELARYMEPSTDDETDDGASEASDDVVPIEIPVELIKPLNARGKFQLSRASLGNIVFENIEVGLNSSNGKMRIFPISSDFFGGSYKGDVRIDVSGATPALSMDEEIAGVDLAQLAKAMFDQDNVTGEIAGSFVLAGKGPNLDTIQRNLDGDLSIELLDGAFVGTDVWYEIRKARALLKGEQAPEAVLPAKTDFNSLRMTGVVTDGVLSSDDLFAELPFMQLTGKGQVNIPAGTLNYAMDARILERPEFLQDATPEELEEFTEAVIPLKITGPIASPSVKPDLEKLLKKRVEDEIKDQLKDKLKGLFD
jgi:AsmA protein